MSAEARVAVLLGLMALAGCDMGPSGYTAPYRPDNPHPVAIKMARNAPSIGQQFRPPAHLGIDIYHAKGTPVLAADRGQVTRLWTDRMYGRQIEITHRPDEVGKVHLTIYRHLASFDVAAGDDVRRGQQIGRLGNSGLLAGGMAHLHFEVLLGGGDVPVDPNLYWQQGAGVIACFDPAQRGRSGLIYPVACD